MEFRLPAAKEIFLFSGTNLSSRPQPKWSPTCAGSKPISDDFSGVSMQRTWTPVASSATNISTGRRSSTWRSIPTSRWSPVSMMPAASVPKGPRSIPNGRTSSKRPSSAFVGFGAIPPGERPLIRKGGHVRPTDNPHLYVAHPRLNWICDTCGWIEGAHVETIETCIEGLLAIRQALRAIVIPD